MLCILVFSQRAVQVSLCSGALCYASSASLIPAWSSRCARWCMSATQRQPCTAAASILLHHNPRETEPDGGLMYKALKLLRTPQATIAIPTESAGF
jgi:hypothetical protein